MTRGHRSGRRQSAVQEKAVRALTRAEAKGANRAGELIYETWQKED